MENRVDEFCLWLIQAVIIPITIGTLEGWSTGYFQKLNEYEDECEKMFEHLRQEEIAQEEEEDIDKKTKYLLINKIWNFFTPKNVTYIVFATQFLHLIYAVYVGKQFPVQPLSDFENSNIIWETVCLCARDATIAMNSHILILRLSCRVIYDVGLNIISNFKNTNNDNNDNDGPKNDTNENVMNDTSDSNLQTTLIFSDIHNNNLSQNDTSDKKIENWVEILDID